MQAPEEAKGVKRLAILSFDLDETVWDFAGPFTAWHNRQYGTCLTAAHIVDYSWEGLALLLGVTVVEAKHRTWQYHAQSDHRELLPLPGAQEGFKKLAQSHDLIALSARDWCHREVTVAALEHWFPGMFQHCLCLAEKDRKTVCKGLMAAHYHASLHVDDSLRHVMACIQRGVPGILFDGGHSWNRGCTVPKGGWRAEGWGVLPHVIHEVLRHPA